MQGFERVVRGFSGLTIQEAGECVTSKVIVKVERSDTHLCDEDSEVIQVREGAHY